MNSQSFVVGVFNDHDVLLGSVKKVKESGIKIHEVYTPYPVHGLEHALGYKHSFMPTAAFLFGVLGISLAILMQTWMLGYDWPMIIGGKPNISIPDFVPVSFELTVLLAAFGMSFTFFGVRGLKPHAIPRVFDRRSTDDKHIMAIDIDQNKTAVEKIKGILEETGAEETFEKTFEDKKEDTSFLAYVSDLFKNGVKNSSRL